MLAELTNVLAVVLEYFIFYMLYNYYIIFYAYKIIC